MKKSLLLLAAATIVVSCSKNEVLKETDQIPIGFTKVYIENGTKASSVGIAKGAYTTTNFETLGNTFGVFGYKNTSSQTSTLLFDDQMVEYNYNKKLKSKIRKNKRYISISETSLEKKLNNINPTHYLNIQSNFMMTNKTKIKCNYSLIIIFIYFKK